MMHPAAQAWYGANAGPSTAASSSSRWPRQSGSTSTSASMGRGPVMQLPPQPQASSSSFPFPHQQQQQPFDAYHPSASSATRFGPTVSHERGNVGAGTGVARSATEGGQSSSAMSSMMMPGSDPVQLRGSAPFMPGSSGSSSGRSGPFPPQPPPSSFAYSQDPTRGAGAPAPARQQRRGGNAVEEDEGEEDETWGEMDEEESGGVAGRRTG